MRRTLRDPIRSGAGRCDDTEARPKRHSAEPGGDVEGELVRSASGITHRLPFVADKVRLLVQVVAIAP
jgi:hypothetical protein